MSGAFSIQYQETANCPLSSLPSKVFQEFTQAVRDSLESSEVQEALRLGLSSLSNSSINEKKLGLQLVLQALDSEAKGIDEEFCKAFRANGASWILTNPKNPDEYDYQSNLEACFKSWRTIYRDLLFADQNRDPNRMNNLVHPKTIGNVNSSWKQKDDRLFLKGANENFKLSSAQIETEKQKNFTLISRETTFDRVVPTANFKIESLNDVQKKETKNEIFLHNSVSDFISQLKAQSDQKPERDLLQNIKNYDELLTTEVTPSKETDSSFNIQQRKSRTFSSCKNIENQFLQPIRKLEPLKNLTNQAKFNVSEPKSSPTINSKVIEKKVVFKPIYDNIEVQSPQPILKPQSDIKSFSQQTSPHFQNEQVRKERPNSIAKEIRDIQESSLSTIYETSQSDPSSLRSIKENEYLKLLNKEYEKYIAELRQELEQERQSKAETLQTMQRLQLKVKKYNQEVTELKKAYGSVISGISRQQSTEKKVKSSNKKNEDETDKETVSSLAVPLFYQAVFNKMGDKSQMSMIESINNPGGKSQFMKGQDLDCSELSIKEMILGEEADKFLVEQSFMQLELQTIEDPSMLRFSKPPQEIYESRPPEPVLSDEVYPDVIDLRFFPQHREGQNLILLKASSLFSNSVYFQNEDIEISCQTIRTHNSVSIAFKFKPEREGLFLSSSITSSLPIQTEPKIRNSRFNGEINQLFTVDLNRHQTLDLMPPLTVEINGKSIVFPIPFTINKFFQADTISLNQALEFLNNSSELHRCQIPLNPSIISNFFQLRDIFPEIVALAADNYFLMLRGVSEDCLIQYKNGKDGILAAIIHGREDCSHFAEIIKWLFWVFGSEC